MITKPAMFYFVQNLLKKLNLLNFGYPQPFPHFDQAFCAKVVRRLSERIRIFAVRP
jgi:hypothetical protein